MTEWNRDSTWWQGGGQALVGSAAAAAAPAVSRGTPSTAAAAGQRCAPQAVRKQPTQATPKQAAAKACKAATDSTRTRKQPWFEFLPLQASVKPTLRPKRPVSRTNEGTIEKQAAKEQQAAAARAARFQKQAAMSGHTHHHQLQLGHAGATPELHIVLGDKGRHRPASARADFIFDPITSTSRPVTAPGRTAAAAGSGLLCPSKSSILHTTPSATAAAAAIAGSSSGRGSTQRRRGSSSVGNDRGAETLFFAGSLYHTFNGELISLQRRPASAASTGRYNPLTHTWTEPPTDASVMERWQNEGRSLCRRPATANGASSASRGLSGRDTVASLLTQSSSSSSLLSSAARRKAVRSGETWGTYDVLRNEWVVPPADTRVANRELGPGSWRVEPLISSNNGAPKPMRKAVTPPSTGVYDPIKAEWKVLPQQRRAAYTLDFAPRKLFEEKAFVNRSK